MSGTLLASDTCSLAWLLFISPPLDSGMQIITFCFLLVTSEHKETNKSRVGKKPHDQGSNPGLLTQPLAIIAVFMDFEL